MKRMDDPGETWMHFLPSEWNWQHPVSVSSSTCQGWVGDIQVFTFVPSFQAVKSMFTNALRFCPCRTPENHVLGISGFLTTQQATVRIIAKVSLGHSIPRLWEGKTLCAEKLSISSLMSPYLDSSILCLFQVGYPYKALMSDNRLVFPNASLSTRKTDSVITFHVLKVQTSI